MTFEMITQTVSGFFGSVTDGGQLKAFFMDNSKGLVMGIAVASLIFILKNNKLIKEILQKRRILSDVNTIMESEGVEFDQAKEHYIALELSKHLRISRDVWHPTAKTTVVSGQRMSFRDKELGNVTGYFIGLINAQVYGYDDLYVVRFRDGTIRQAPISCVEVDTVYVHRKDAFRQ